MTEINCFSFGITQLAVLLLQKVGKKMPAIATAAATVQEWMFLFWVRSRYILTRQIFKLDRQVQWFGWHHLHYGLKLPLVWNFGSDGRGGKGKTHSMYYWHHSDRIWNIVKKFLFTITMCLVEKCLFFKPNFVVESDTNTYGMSVWK